MYQALNKFAAPEHKHPRPVSNRIQISPTHMQIFPLLKNTDTDQVISTHGVVRTSYLFPVQEVYNEYSIIFLQLFVGVYRFN